MAETTNNNISKYIPVRLSERVIIGTYASTTKTWTTDQDILPNERFIITNGERFSPGICVGDDKNIVTFASSDDINNIDDVLALRNELGTTDNPENGTVYDRLNSLETIIGDGSDSGEGNILSRLDTLDGYFEGSEGGVDSRIESAINNLAGDGFDRTIKENIDDVIEDISELRNELGTTNNPEDGTVYDRLNSLENTVGITDNTSDGTNILKNIDDLNKIPVTSGDREMSSLVGFNDGSANDHKNIAVGVDSIAIGTGVMAGSYGFTITNATGFNNEKISGTDVDVKHKSTVNKITIQTNNNYDLTTYLNTNDTYQCAMRLALNIILDDSNKETTSYPQQYFTTKIKTIEKHNDGSGCYDLTFSDGIKLDIDDDSIVDITKPFIDGNFSPTDPQNGIDYETNCFRIIKISNDIGTTMPNVDDNPLASCATRYPGSSAVAFGDTTYALSKNAFAEGYGTIAYGSHSHAEGYCSEAAYCAHAEGKNTKALGNQAHTEGLLSIARGSSSHAEGQETEAAEQQSHAEGLRTKALNKRAHAEGDSTKASGIASHSEGMLCEATGDSSHAEGYDTTASGNKAHAEGTNTEASGESSHAEGSGTIAKGNKAHAEGNETQAPGPASHSEGLWTRALADQTHAEGLRTTAMGVRSHAEGQSNNIAADKGITSTTSIDEILSIWGAMKTNARFSLARGLASHSEGEDTLALSNRAHAEGQDTIASGPHAHAEGYSTKATKDQAHAEGYNTKASGDKSHAEGSGTEASGSYSHAAGYYTIAKNEAQTVVGKYNADVKDSLFIVGNGSSSKRSNAFVVHGDGRATISSEPKNNMDVVNKEYLEKYFANTLESFLINEHF